MSHLIHHRDDSSQAILLPPVRVEGGVTIRPAVESDFEFIDRLQKMHSHMVGFLRTGEIKGHIEKGHVVVAEQSSVVSGQWSERATGNCQLTTGNSVGYCIACDHYLRQDHVGIVYQLNVLPIQQRHLIGATLVKATFERAAYGCKLFCCWCAQDIQANWFWESIGFIPLAFRTGSRAKQRIQIFWQRRIREGDETTPYWFPYKTDKGAVNEDRLVIPIPPGTLWREAKPVILPGVPGVPGEPGGPGGPEMPKDMPKQLPGGALVKPRAEQPAELKMTKAQAVAVIRSKSKHLGGLPVGKAAVITRGGLKYVDRADAPVEEAAPKPKRPRSRSTTPRQKNDPKLVAAARELRDRYLEQVNSSMLLPPSACGKYDVSRALEAAPSSVGGGTVKVEQLPAIALLDAA